MTEEVPINRNRMVLLLIAGIPLTMILAASWLWFFVVRGDLDLVGSLGTANRGSLLQPPRQIDDSTLLDEDGYPFKYRDLEPKWTMLVPSSGAICGADCERSLYLTRQIHVAMGKDFPRLRRMYVGDARAGDTPLAGTEAAQGAPGAASLGEFIATEHRGVRTVVANKEVQEALFGEYLNDRSTWYLVDPAGWVMMSYNSDVPYKDVISDLKFLLKNSSK
jgi:hypothetical protein